jgi:YwiC-like protein
MIVAPREHGAYGQLILPIVTAMAIGRPTLAAVALAAAAAAAFLIHEPAIILVSGRGARALRERRRDALGTLIGSAVAALLFGVTAIVLMPAASRWSVSAPLALGFAVGALVSTGRERTTVGEVVVAAAFASVAIPVAVASAAPTPAALACALAFATTFAAATVSVRAVIARARGGGEAARAAALATAVLLLSIVAALAAGGVVLPAAPWAAAPMCAIALGIAVVTPPPRYLRQIGWTLVGASVVTALILVVAIG